MTIGIVGLGLIGGSLALAFKRAEHRVYGLDAQKSIMDFAVMAGSIDGELDDISSCDVIFLAVPPKAAARWLKDHTLDSSIKPKSIIIDCCGTKEKICTVGFALAEEGGFTFIGGHPMAGKQVGGYKNSSADLFDGAMFALVPNDKNGDRSDVMLMMKIQSLLKEAGFREFALMTPEEHDKVIAFTSQMAHLISNAYIKSDMAKISVGTELSGGAFRDMTRVAYLDEAMWTELFMENRENLLSELNSFIDELNLYKEALATGNEEALTSLLLEGKLRKERINQEKECKADCIECKLMQ